MSLLSVLYLGVLLVYVCAVWVVHQVFMDRWDSMELRHGVNEAQYPDLLSKWLQRLTYLWAGPDIILKNYVPGVPYMIRTPETTYVHVSSEEHIAELKTSSKDQLSLHAWANDMLRPELTMGGLEVKDNGNANGTLHHRVLRVVLTAHIPDMYASLSEIVASALLKEMSRGTQEKDGWTKLPSWAMAKRIITTANARVYFGTELTQNVEFQDAIHEFVEDLLFTTEILRWTPSITHSFIAPYLMRNHKASQTIIKHLTPTVEQRLLQARSRLADHEPTASKPVDCVQFFVDANIRKQEWTASRIVQVVLGMWFASVHQPALTLVYALENLCEHPEYVEPLRQEMFSAAWGMTGDIAAGSRQSAASSLEGLVLLDAFMKESSRLRPSDAISARRKVLQTYTFKDGLQIPAGDVLCVPMNAILRDEGKYPDSETFSPWRFIKSTVQPGGNQEVLENTSRFTDTDFSYPLWGFGGHACPGRFYASFIMKICIVHVLKHYEVQLGSEPGPRRFYFRTSTIPHWNSTLRFRPRT